MTSRLQDSAGTPRRRARGLARAPARSRSRRGRSSRLREGSDHLDPSRETRRGTGSRLPRDRRRSPPHASPALAARALRGARRSGRPDGRLGRNHFGYHAAGRQQDTHTAVERQGSVDIREASEARFWVPAQQGILACRAPSSRRSPLPRCLLKLSLRRGDKRPRGTAAAGGQHTTRPEAARLRTRSGRGAGGAQQSHRRQGQAARGRGAAHPAAAARPRAAHAGAGDRGLRRAAAHGAGGPAHAGAAPLPRGDPPELRAARALRGRALGGRRRRHRPGAAPAASLRGWPRASPPR